MSEELPVHVHDAWRAASRSGRRFVGSVAVRDVVQIVGLILVYFVSGKIGLRLAFLHVSATPVWPPTGIALAALLLLGNRVWPGILLGAFWVNELTAGSVATSFGIAVGNTLEALIGAALIRRYSNGRFTFTRPLGVFKFTGLAALLSTMVAATVGVTTLSIGGYARWADYGAIWSTWWLGDAVGCLIVAPPIILWVKNPHLQWRTRRALEAALLGLALVAVGLLLFTDVVVGSGRGSPLGFLCLPVLLWTAFRFGRREAATATLILSAVAVAGTLQGFGPFGGRDRNDSLLLLQGFMGTIAVTVLALAAVISERQRAGQELRLAHDELEERIVRRTADLSRVVESLHAEMEERKLAEARLAESELGLATAQKLAHIGSWSWDVARNRVTWSDELFRIYGLVPQSRPMSYENYLELVHPEDRTLVEEIVSRSFRTGEPFGIDHRLLRPDGSVRWVHGLGQVVMGENGPLRMHGTAHDITERKLAETERKRLEQEILEVSNQEQERLGQDLHDDLGQLLIGIAFMSKTLEKKMGKKLLTETEAMSEIRRLVNRAIAKTKSLARVLCPVSLETEGLATAIQELAASTHKVFNVSCVFEVGEALPITSHLAAMHLYRIVQEAISNAVRHGRADRIWIVLESDGNAGLRLGIRDNGIGFRPGSDDHKGLGLRLMQYRAGLIGGTLDIRSDAMGTAVTCRVKRTDPRHAGRNALAADGRAGMEVRLFPIEPSKKVH
jgi:PAS domain S-box-containing protein